MTVEWIERDGKKWQIMYGYGRLQRARFLLYSLLPDSLKRAHIADPDGTGTDLLKRATPEDALSYTTRTGVEIAKLVLNEATDWDKSTMDVSTYVDSSLPSDVGDEIFRRVSNAIEDGTVSGESKKNSP